MSQPNLRRSPQSFSLFLALRYLKPKRTFLSVITTISIAGVMLGITVLILVISVMTGFERELQRKVIGFDAHIVVSNGQILEDWRPAMEQAETASGAIGAAPFVVGPVIVEYENHRLAPKIKGIDPKLESTVTDISKFIVAGELKLEQNEAVIGSELARALNVGVGDVITLYSPQNFDNVLSELDRIEKEGGEQKDLANLREMILPTDLVVTGIFESGRYLYDSEFILVPLHIAQEAYNLAGVDGVHGISLKTSDPYRAVEARDAILNSLGPPFLALTWMDMNKQLFDAIRMERNVMFFILLFIIIVAAFGIMNTLITTTVQKTREIGIIKALGANVSQITGVFLLQGVVVGFFGTLAGLGLGMTLVRYRNEVSRWLAEFLGVEVFPAAVYQFAEIPAEVVASDVAIICVSAFVICSIAAVIPAYFAARLDPVQALRSE